MATLFGYLFRGALLPPLTRRTLRELVGFCTGQILLIDTWITNIENVLKSGYVAKLAARCVNF